MANQGWLLTPAKVSDPVPVFVMLMQTGARSDAPTFTVQLKPVGLTDNIDSLLVSSFFSLEERCGEPSLFYWSVKRKGNGICGQGHCAQFGAIVGLVGAEHGR
jgi:hypothetical protein